ncbi:hypothetical protein [Halomicronema sp. CCY15110]|uniref:hypothetical protein n=1 Tax=Halomicronema sp. CCY15110 TaxID=2767773 RepID=UPI00194EF6D8|nr:hypothetical protein [Halomicronema sp. CCY15110]
MIYHRDRFHGPPGRGIPELEQSFSEDFPIDPSKKVRHDENVVSHAGSLSFSSLSAMSSPVLNLSSSLECPKCSKNSIVSHQNGIYQCLSCNFERDLSTENEFLPAKGGLGELVFAIGGFLVAAALIL